MSNRSVPKKTTSNSQKSSTTNTNTNQIRKDLDDLKAKTADLEKKNLELTKAYKSVINKPSSTKFFNEKSKYWDSPGWVGFGSLANKLVGIWGIWAAWEVYENNVKNLPDNDPRHATELGIFVTTMVTQFFLANLVSKTASYLFAIPLGIATGGRLGFNSLGQAFMQPAIKAAFITFINSADGRIYLEKFLKALIAGSTTLLGELGNELFGNIPILKDTPLGKVLDQYNKQDKNKTTNQPSLDNKNKTTSTSSSSNQETPIVSNDKEETPQTIGGVWYLDTKTGELVDKPSDTAIMIAKGPDKELISNAGLSSNPNLSLYRRSEINKGRPDPLEKFLKPGQSLPYLP